MAWEAMSDVPVELVQIRQALRRRIRDYDESRSILQSEHDLVVKKLEGLGKDKLEAAEAEYAEKLKQDVPAK